ncbi:unnamed protein product [Jaminaea pallidilutea]
MSGRDPSYLNAQPGFLNAGPGRRPNEPPRSSNFLVRFWRDEVVHPEKSAANLALLWGVGVAVAGVTFIRAVGKDLLVPAF